MDFKLHSKYQPTGDQPQAIDELCKCAAEGTKYQTLLGVTGSGKTFTMANVIERLNRPTLVLSHNKTLAAQLYAEFKNYFPDNAVHYFVSYYDYYQPEAYIPSSDKYIEKDLMINDEIDRLRLAATTALLSGRRDVIIVSSVSCLYGIGNPEDFDKNVVEIKVGQQISRNELLRKLVDSLYSRNENELGRGQFRVKGDTIDLYLAYEEIIIRIIFWGDEIESISALNPETMYVESELEGYKIFPANIFVTTKERTAEAIGQIEIDLGKQVEMFRNEGREIEAKRLYERVTYDVEMIREVGYCSGIENYSRYFDGREPGMRPFCLLDYFPEDFLTIIDESHVTIPQIRAMYGGDISRKMNLVEYGFRLPAAIDNRPLKFEEFEAATGQTIYVSATPADYELEKSEGVIVEQLIRPTGLLDPLIIVRPSKGQIDDLLEEITRRIENHERTLVTTLTKRMAEELTSYLAKLDINCAYIHSDVDTMDRIQILDDLRAGVIDVLIGVNLLREGLDYADKITDSMRLTIEETERRRSIQLAYNEKNGITPKAIIKDRTPIIGQDNRTEKQHTSKKSVPQNKYTYPDKKEDIRAAADPVVSYMTKEELQKAIAKTRQDMLDAAKNMDFLSAAQLRDEMLKMEDLLNGKS